MTHKVDGIYEAKGLNYDEALHLFSLKAFRKDYPPKLYLNVSKHFVQYANGLPLAIKVLGSFLFNRSIDEWKIAFDRLKEFSERKILDVLQISFDGLHETEKEIFLHIACFFNQEEQDHVIEILDCLDLYPKIGLRVLIDKSLIKVHSNQLWMHDLLQEMGWDIVRQKCRKELWKRSRLWLCKDIDKVLTSNSGTKAIQGIVLKLPKPNETHWNPKAFSKMHHLELLIIHYVHLLHEPKHLSNGLRYLDWSEYPSTSLPSSFQPNVLVGLRMCYSNIERLWKGTQSLKDLNLSECSKLDRLPENLGNAKSLEKLDMGGTAITKLPSSIVNLSNLASLNLKDCKNLVCLTRTICNMKSLKDLNLSGCSKLDKLLENLENAKVLEDHNTCGTTNTKSIQHFTGLHSLNLRDCKNLVCLSSTIFNMKSLKDLDLYGCSKLKNLLENLGNAEGLLKLDAGGTTIQELPSSIVLLKIFKSFLFVDVKGHHHLNHGMSASLFI
ncbi:disease resistance protein RPV1-like [Quercus robur]|uniref:disease resistance protein RPV1-like n=1 Tax=Quercus robur TaxID=38942 RepID=UPI002163E4BA|nr:disease resistance protein RPV1-like [Quercus robur]